MASDCDEVRLVMFPVLSLHRTAQEICISSQWRHNGRDGVSNHQPHNCLLNRLFRRISNKTSKLCVTGLCAGNSPHKWPVTLKMFPFDDVIVMHIICGLLRFGTGWYYPHPSRLLHWNWGDHTMKPWRIWKNRGHEYTRKSPYNHNKTMHKSNVNPLRAKFFRGNINIHLHFVSFLHIDMTQVVEILPQIRQEPTYST